MKLNSVFCIMILMLLAQAGCGSQQTPAPGQVVYSLSATLDGKPLPALVGIKAESCDNGYGGFTLTFTATADMEPQAIDDEISLGLNIKIDDMGKTTIGKPIEVGINSNIQLSANVRVFIEGPQDPLTTATGMITITTLSQREMSGSASLMFTDTSDVNPTVKDSLAYEVAFSNLAVIHYCPEPTLTDIQFVLNDKYNAGEIIVLQRDFALLRDFGPLFKADFRSKTWLKVS